VCEYMCVCVCRYRGEKGGGGRGGVYCFCLCMCMLDDLDGLFAVVINTTAVSHRDVRINTDTHAYTHIYSLTHT
jgi:hypothetical protein